MDKINIEEHYKHFLNSTDEEIIKAMKISDTVIDMAQPIPMPVRNVQTVAHNMTEFELLPEKLQQEIRKYYLKKLQNHSKMSKGQLLRMCGKKFNIKFEEYA